LSNKINISQQQINLGSSGQNYGGNNLLNSSGNMNFNGQQNERRKMSMNYSTHLPTNSSKMHQVAQNQIMSNSNNFGQAQGNQQLLLSSQQNSGKSISHS
jgi:hypothetical protein